MDEKATDPRINRGQEVTQRAESHMVYELKQRREYLIRQLTDVQKAIDAVNNLNF